MVSTFRRLASALFWRPAQPLGSLLLSCVRSVVVKARRSDVFVPHHVFDGENVLSSRQQVGCKASAQVVRRKSVDFGTFTELSQDDVDLAGLDSVVAERKQRASTVAGR